MPTVQGVPGRRLAIPKFLEDYGDIFMSLSYYRQCLDQLLPQVQSFMDGVAMVRANRQFAKFNKIGIDSDGSPNPADLRAAWAAGARGFRLTPR